MGSSWSSRMRKRRKKTRRRNFSPRPAARSRAQSLYSSSHQAAAAALRQVHRHLSGRWAGWTACPRWPGWTAVRLSSTGRCMTGSPSSSTTCRSSWPRWELEKISTAYNGGVSDSGGDPHALLCKSMVRIPYIYNEHLHSPHPTVNALVPLHVHNIYRKINMCLKNLIQNLCGQFYPRALYNAAPDPMSGKM